MKQEEDEAEQVLLLKIKCLKELTAHPLLRNAAGTCCPALKQLKCAQKREWALGVPPASGGSQRVPSFSGSS